VDSSVWNWLLVFLLAPRILRLFLEFLTKKMFTPVLGAIRFSPFSIHFLYFPYYKVSGLQDKKMIVMTKEEKL
jgi:hypothetical protein